MAFRVLVDDNFHYMDEEHRYQHGEFLTFEAAVAAAQQIVDEYLASAYESGMTARELFESYMAFGEDPFILSPDIKGVPFSAWDYARRRCTELCAPG
jgi:hypothetical protein